MTCTIHPDSEAAGTCVGCAESFCQNCLVVIGTESYCGSCKQMAVKQPPDLEMGQIPCHEANQALWYAIIGIFCFGIILEPVALYKANKAKKMIEADPRLSGSGKVTAAIIIAVCVFLIWTLGVYARLVQGP